MISRKISCNGGAMWPSPAVRGQPEVREYRARFWEGTTAISGERSPVEGVTDSG